MKAKNKNSRDYVKIKGELNRIHQRRSRILKELKKLIPHFIAAVILRNNIRILCIEDLDFDPRKMKGTLAKVFYSIPDEEDIFVKAVSLASSISEYDISLVKVDPRGTSFNHNMCGGKLKRTRSSYDFATCDKCGYIVNTHINAAKNIQERGLNHISRFPFAPSRTVEGLGILP